MEFTKISPCTETKASKRASSVQLCASAFGYLEERVCVSVSVCANLCEKSLLNHLPFLRLFVKKSVRYDSNTIIQAPHGTSIIFSCIRENYADDG